MLAYVALIFVNYSKAFNTTAKEDHNDEEYTLPVQEDVQRRVQ